MYLLSMMFLTSWQNIGIQLQLTLCQVVTTPMSILEMQSFPGWWSLGFDWRFQVMQLIPIVDYAPVIIWRSVIVFFRFWQCVRQETSTVQLIQFQFSIPYNKRELKKQAVFAAYLQVATQDPLYNYRNFNVI